MFKNYAYARQNGSICPYLFLGLHSMVFHAESTTITICMCKFSKIFGKMTNFAS